MTCIVGVAHEGRVYMGADSAGVSGPDIVVRADRKVFVNGPFVMGFTTSFRMGQLLAYSMQVPPRHPGTDLMEYMVTTFVDAVRDTLKAGGFASRKDETEEGGVFLVGTEGRLFKIEGDYQVGESIHGFDACGCGESIALGSLYETRDEPPTKRIQRALEAAQTFSAGVRSPFHQLAA